MVILITGASHSGKTLLAQRILEALHYPYMSIDHLKMGLIRSGITALTPQDDDELTRFLWPIVHEIIKTALENQQNLIIEGCYVPFNWRSEFDAALLEHIRFICLAFSENFIDMHFDEIKEHGCDIEARLDDSYCTLEMLKCENKHCIEGFGASGERVTVIDRDYTSAIDDLMEHITNIAFAAFFDHARLIKEGDTQ